MAREIPEAVRAIAGLAVTVLDEARKLPETLPGLPVRLVGAAMQTSLKLQQQYAGLVARGDELLTGLQGDGGGGLATFDDDDEQPTAGPATGSPARDSAFDRVSEADLDDGLDEDISDIDDDLGRLATIVELDDDAAITVESTVADGSEVLDLPADPAADLVTAVVDELADDVAAEVAEELPEALPEEVAEDLVADAVADLAGAEVDEETAIEQAVAADLVADAVVVDDEPAGGSNVEAAAAAASQVVPLDDLTPDSAPQDTATLEDADPPVAALADAAGELTDLGGPDAADDAAPASTGETTGSPALVAPVEAYDSYSIPALRGHLRSYPAETVADLLDYERATAARQPYVTLLQNRLEKLNADRG